MLGSVVPDTKSLFSATNCTQPHDVHNTEKRPVLEIGNVHMI